MKSTCGTLIAVPPDDDSADQVTVSDHPAEYSSHQNTFHVEQRRDFVRYYKWGYQAWLAYVIDNNKPDLAGWLAHWSDMERYRENGGDLMMKEIEEYKAWPPMS